MDIMDIKKAKFEESRMTLYYPSVSDEKSREFTIRYVKDKNLRDKVIEFVTAFTKEFPYSFINCCTECGNCCTMENIKVKGEELFRLATIFDLEEKEFHDKYLNPCPTISEYDGYIKLKKGKCPFLKKEKTGKHLCSIYENRPEHCRLFIPPLEMCEKKEEELIEEIKFIEIENDRTSIYLRNGLLYHYILNEKLKKLYLEILSIIGDINKNRPGGMINDLKDILEELEKTGLSRPELKKYLKRMKNIMDNIKDDEKPPLGEIEEFKNRLLKLEMEERYKELPNSEKTSPWLWKRKNFILREIVFFDFSFGISYTIDDIPYNYYIKYEENENLLKNGRALFTVVTKLMSEVFPLSLELQKNHCYTCGYCCSCFLVEVNPSDIMRLAKEFNLTEERFREKYMEPPKFGWNPGNGIFKRYPDNGRKRCIFLKRNKRGNYLCSVHHAKPDLCRAYRTGKSTCYAELKDEDYYKLLSHIQSIQVGSEELNMTTKTYKKFSVKWKNYIELKQSVEDFLKNLKNHVGKHFL